MTHRSGRWRSAVSSIERFWSYGLDYGEFFGRQVTHYVKDVPLSRVEGGGTAATTSAWDSIATSLFGV